MGVCAFPSIGSDVRPGRLLRPAALRAGVQQRGDATAAAGKPRPSIVVHHIFKYKALTPSISTITTTATAAAAAAAAEAGSHLAARAHILRHRRGPDAGGRGRRPRLFAVRQAVRRPARGLPALAAAVRAAHWEPGGGGGPGHAGQSVVEEDGHTYQKFAKLKWRLMMS